MALAILPTVMIFLHAELLKGLQKTREYIIVHSICIPAITIIVFVILCILIDLGVLGVIWAHLVAVYITALSGLILWRSAIKGNLKGIKGYFPWRRMFKSSMPLFWVTIMNFVMMWTSTLVLGVWGTTAQVGIYTTAYRTSMLTGFILITVNTIVAPKFAEYYSLNQMKRLEDMASSSVRIMCFLALPLLIVFIVFPHWIMGLFGSQFRQGGLCLSILACGQFVNVATGSVGYILMMSGHENLMRNAITLSGSLNILLNLWLVPQYGIIGGAIATAISVTTLNVIAAYFVWAFVKIKPLPLPFINSRYLSVL
jgi:O-antigen/teichoic acid export membrane protein